MRSVTLDAAIERDYIHIMEIETISHKALRKFFLTGNGKGLDTRFVDRIAKMLNYLGAIEQIEEFFAPPNYGAHQLTGDRAGTWSLTVSKNWRMTFSLNEAGAIIDLDLEDYH